MRPALPPARDGTPYRVAVVCLGNICRSPMAAVVLADRIEAAGLGDRVEVASAGTGGWHVGGPMDPRAASLLTRHGYDATRHRAQQLGVEWLARFDLLLAMDAQNHEAVSELGPAPHLLMFRDFDPVTSRGRDVPDPYFGGDDGFERVLHLVERTADGLVDALADELANDPVPEDRPTTGAAVQDSPTEPHSRTRPSSA